MNKVILRDLESYMKILDESVGLDQEQFESVVGCKVEDLVKELETWIGSNILSNDKFISSPLNKKGLHVFRCILAEACYWYRSTNHLPKCSNFVKEMSRELDEQGYVFRESLFPDITPQNALELTKDVGGWLKDLLGVKYCVNPAHNNQPNGKLMETIHQSYDVQHSLHSDIFFPNLKSFIALKDMTVEDGPFVYVPESHSYENPARMKWDYYVSTTKTDQKKVYEPLGPGSFRIWQDATLEQELEELEKWGFNKPLTFTVPKGSLIIANVRGFHARSRGTPGLKRTYMSWKCRPFAFDLGN